MHYLDYLLHYLRYPCMLPIQALTLISPTALISIIKKKKKRLAVLAAIS